MGELDRLVWADSFSVDLDGFTYELRGTSVEFVRSAAGLVHLPIVDREPDFVFSAVVRPTSVRATPVLSLYEGCRAVVRTLSAEMLLQTFLWELRSRALMRATDRVSLKVPAIRISGAGVMLPSFALRRMVRLERTAERTGTELLIVPALTLDLRAGQPVASFASESGPNVAGLSSIDFIAVTRGPDGRLPSRSEVLFELTQRVGNMRGVGANGLEALGLLVERAQLIEWDEARPHAMLERVAEKPVAMERVG